MPEPTVPDRTDTPAVALGPTALVLGAVSVVFAYVMFPWAIIAGALAVTLGAAGIHNARHGIGRLWTAIAGTTLGGLGFTGATTFLWALGA
ncbi:hypothetical protein [Streptomyces sp. ISL-98]|uniref:hypothetical protein n=1 Tax=Streptomyces sp. ISL-98 TaxID=2819192 RepID=UPI0020355413|nr:hypothetical protein [Streptomyces sp. ISL-98]